MFHQVQLRLNPLPPYPFETAKALNAKVNSFSMVRFSTNSYSVPITYVGCQVGLKIFPETIEIYAHGKLISKHQIVFGQHQSQYHLSHYLPLLEVRGRAILNAAPVKQNVPPEVIDELKQYQNSKTAMAH